MVDDDDEFEEVEPVVDPDDPEVVDLDSIEEDDDLLDDETALADDVLVDDVLVDDDIVVEPDPTLVVADDEDDEDDEDDDPDDVEAGLDVILKDRMIVVEEDEEEEEEEEEAPDPEERTDTTSKVAPKRPGEFVCQSCFLVKHSSQLADPGRQWCRDCV